VVRRRRRDLQHRFATRFGVVLHGCPRRQATGGVEVPAARRRSASAEAGPAGTDGVRENFSEAVAAAIPLRAPGGHRAGRRRSGSRMKPAWDSREPSPASGPGSPTAAFEERMQRNFDAKRRIAQMAAQEIGDNQSVVFDSGSTLLQVAMQMPPVTNVVVATTAMNIAQHLMHRQGLDVHMIGGRVIPSTVGTIVGDADRAVGGLLAHQAFLGAHAIDPAFDVVDRSEDIARTKRNLVRMARRVILVADSSKWDIGASSKAFSLSQVDLIITDTGLAQSIRDRLENLKVEVRYV